MSFDFNIANILALFSGAVIWEGFKFIYPDIKNYFVKRQKAHTIFYESLDSILKASDELIGKMESLAKEDFSTFINLVHSNSKFPEHNQIYVCYLISQHWAALESIRLQSSYTSISRLKKGKQLLAFVETFESRKFRLLDRSKQRLIAEAMIINAEDKLQVLSLYSFFERVEKDKQFAKWVEELRGVFLATKNKSIRQRILIYGIIVEAFINHFDEKRHIARERKVYLNKLRPESKKMIQQVLLNQYLPFLKNPRRYYK